MRKTCLFFACLTLFGIPPAFAQDYVLTLKDHQFQPKELSIPAGQKVRLLVRNMDSTVAEFESSDLNREKIVTANSEVSVYVGPLSIGRYGFFDDFHRDTTAGSLIVK